MTAPFRALFVLVAVLAIATLFNALLVQRVEVAVVLGVVAGLLIGIAVGVAVRPRADRGQAIDESSGLLPPDPPAPPAPAPPAAAAAADGADANDATVLFAQELVGASTTDRFRRVVATHLPALLGTPRVWITARVRGSPQLLVPDRSESSMVEDLLDPDGREWTTFGLRVDNETVGVLGVESRGGLTLDARSVVRRVAPLIAQAMTTAQVVDSLRERSLVDLLTGLATRTEGMSRLESEIKRAQRSGTSMAVLMLDLDQFKSINDRFGHAVGDQLLQRFAAALRTSLHGRELFGRYGGEEFLVLFPDTSLELARQSSERLRDALRDQRLRVDEEEVVVTLSLGLACYEQGDVLFDQIARRADIALYVAKTQGRDRIEVYNPSRHGTLAPATAVRQR